ncbi:MAG TPA: IclR family transcriptional regulator [Marmoricola sp.]|nr:IclR family transcriptional regulator [Marmoricola sp.]
MTAGVQSVSRALDLIEHIAEAGGSAGLSELAERSGLPLSTVHRIVRSLVGDGYLAQGADRRYRLGLRLVPLGEAAHGPLAPWTVRLPALVEATGETANAATLVGTTVLFVSRVASPFAMRSAGEVGRRAPVHASAAGKALLSLLPEEAVARLLSGVPLPALTPRTVTSVDALLEEIALVRSRGYAVDDEEEEKGARCVAVPVPAAPVPLALSLSGPTARITPRRVPELAAALRDCSERTIVPL